MPALASDLRKTLENTVVKAREKAEGGARDALTALAVGASEPFASMSEEERKLRNRLRARGRQLGDQRDPQKGSQGIERLVREMAYEHWHRMLFARFLAENQLLIEPSSGVSISARSSPPVLDHPFGRSGAAFPEQTAPPAPRGLCPPRRPALRIHHG